MGNVKQFVEYLNNAVGNAYLWGGQGETLKDVVTKYANAKKQSEENTNKMLGFIEQAFPNALGMKLYDCSGLGVRFLLDNGYISKDTTADGLRKKCSPISMSDVQAGDFVFLLNQDGTAYHVGYVVENNNVVHAFNTQKGVIKESIKMRNWVSYRSKFFEEEQNTFLVNDSVSLSVAKYVYNTAENAVKEVNPVTSYPVGTYYVYKVYGDCVNISRRIGVAGGWIKKEYVTEVGKNAEK